jgi:hypothetical protein
MTLNKEKKWDTALTVDNKKYKEQLEQEKHQVASFQL